MNPSSPLHASTTSPESRGGAGGRLAVAAYLGSLSLGIALLFVGACQASLAVLAFGALALLAAGGFWMTIRENASAEMVDALSSEAGEPHVPAARASNPGGPKIAELASLLHELNALEGKRGSGHFDPWALQSVRSDIRLLVLSSAEIRSVLHVD